MLKPAAAELCHPDPYFEIVFDCRPLEFYELKSVIQQLVATLDLKAEKLKIHERYAADGSLQAISMLNSASHAALIQAILGYVDFDPMLVPLGTELRLRY